MRSVWQIVAVSILTNHWHNYIGILIGRSVAMTMMFPIIQLFGNKVYSIILKHLSTCSTHARVRAGPKRAGSCWLNTCLQIHVKIRKLFFENCARIDGGADIKRTSPDQVVFNFRKRIDP